MGGQQREIGIFRRPTRAARLSRARCTGTSWVRWVLSPGIRAQFERADPLARRFDPRRTTKSALEQGGRHHSFLLTSTRQQEQFPATRPAPGWKSCRPLRRRARGGSVNCTMNDLFAPAPAASSTATGWPYNCGRWRKAACKAKSGSRMTPNITGGRVTQLCGPPIVARPLRLPGPAPSPHIWTGTLRRAPDCLPVGNAPPELDSKGHDGACPSKHLYWLTPGVFREGRASSRRTKHLAWHICARGESRNHRMSWARHLPSPGISGTAPPPAGEAPAPTARLSAAACIFLQANCRTRSGCSRTQATSNSCNSSVCRRSEGVQGKARREPQPRPALLTRPWCVNTTNAVAVGSTTRCSRYQLVAGMRRISAGAFARKSSTTRGRLPSRKSRSAGFQGVFRGAGAHPQQPGEHGRRQSRRVERIPGIDQRQKTCCAGYWRAKACAAAGRPPLGTPPP